MWLFHFLFVEITFVLKFELTTAMMILILFTGLVYYSFGQS
jgi:hypothetical protein